MPNEVSALLLLQDIKLARDGDEQAMAALIAMLLPVINGTAASSICPGLDFEDAAQEGTIALFHAVKTFDVSGGANFKTYASVCIRNAITSAVRTATRNKHAPLNTSVPLNETEAVPGPEEILLSNERYSTAMHTIDTQLSALEKQVLARFLDGESYASIAHVLGVPEKAVDNALQRVRAKLK